MGTQESLVIAQSQQAPSPMNIEGTLKHLATTAAQCAEWGVNLLVLPEMCLTGYNLTPDEIAPLAEPADGYLFESVAALCQKHNLAIVYGYAEKNGTKEIFNSAQLVDQSGISQLNYRKAHLWGELDRSLFSAGDTLSPVVSVCGWKIGAAICYDAEFPETLRHLAIKGAELVVIPTGLMSPWSEVAEKVMPVRAYENRLFVAYTNYCGDERELSYVGHSCIADPNGHILASAAKDPVILTATLERSVLKDSRATLPYLTERRPELYETLNTSTNT